MSIKNPEVKYTQLFINNEFVNSADGKTFQTMNPTTEEVLAVVQEGGTKDIDRAVQAAKKAFQFHSDYRQMDATQRAALLFKLADLIERDMVYLASLECKNNGKVFNDAYNGDLPTAVAALRFYAGAADKVSGSVLPTDGKAFAYTRYEPVGIIGAIIPWNYPIELTCLKIGPAIAMGNTLVIKPAEQTPLTALYLASLIKEAGFPPGVVNIVPGFGPTTGQPLVEHPDVNMITFTGSTEVGRLIQQLGAQHIKRVSLELGGKSPLIIFPDADLDKAVQVAHAMCVVNQGQCCVAATRTFVHENIYDEFVKKTVELAKKHVIGDPLDTNVDHGPQIDHEQFTKVLSLIESGIKEGAKLEIGGKRLERKGLFVEPTVFSNVTDTMRIAREEIFGPVQQILKFSSKEEVIERANNTTYGLGAGLFTSDLNTALEVSARLNAGQVYVNQYLIGGPQVPFGGFKQSGLNREFGLDGLKQYYEVKAVVVDMPVKI
uniref:Retinal dehydrogenase 1 n=1 Tax=Aceria tosichella TaxID=561515 RepID=A0A6G1SAT3_9ACAR